MAMGISTGPARNSLRIFYYILNVVVTAFSVISSAVVIVLATACDFTLSMVGMEYSSRFLS